VISKIGVKEIVLVDCKGSRKKAPEESDSENIGILFFLGIFGLPDYGYIRMYL